METLKLYSINQTKIFLVANLSTKKFHIHIFKIKNFTYDFSDEVKNHLTNVFPNTFCTESLVNSNILKEAYNPSRNQYYSTTLLYKLQAFAKNVKADKFLAVVDVDLYVPNLNFVFGEAQCPGRFAIISVYRLKQEFYGLTSDKALFISRVKKEAVHELGHTLGLLHCRKPTCVMFFSNSILDTDRKQDVFCPECNKKVLKILKEMSK